MVSKVDLAELRRMADAGCTRTDAVRRFGVSKEYVRQLVAVGKRFNVHGVLCKKNMGCLFAQNSFWKGGGQRSLFKIMEVRSCHIITSSFQRNVNRAITLRDCCVHTPSAPIQKGGCLSA